MEATNIHRTGAGGGGAGEGGAGGGRGRRVGGGGGDSGESGVDVMSVEVRDNYSGMQLVGVLQQT